MYIRLIGTESLGVRGLSCVPDTKLGTVMMTRIEVEDTVLVHASDIQFLDGNAVSLIRDWRPDIVLAGRPSLYLP